MRNMHRAPQQKKKPKQTNKQNRGRVEGYIILHIKLQANIFDHRPPLIQGNRSVTLYVYPLYL
jgi:hypothetical protein